MGGFGILEEGVLRQERHRRRSESAPQDRADERGLCSPTSLATLSPSPLLVPPQLFAL